MAGLKYGDNMIMRQFGKKGAPDTYRSFVKDPDGTFQGSDGILWRETTESNQPNKQSPEGA